jgi:hypothetical protein
MRRPGPISDGRSGCGSRPLHPPTPRCNWSDRNEPVGRAANPSTSQPGKPRYTVY